MEQNEREFFSLSPSPQIEMRANIKEAGVTGVWGFGDVCGELWMDLLSLFFIVKGRHCSLVPRYRWSGLLFPASFRPGGGGGRG